MEPHRRHLQPNTQEQVLVHLMEKVFMQSIIIVARANGLKRGGSVSFIDPNPPAISYIRYRETSQQRWLEVTAHSYSPLSWASTGTGDDQYKITSPSSSFHLHCFAWSSSSAVNSIFMQVANEAGNISTTDINFRQDGMYRYYNVATASGRKVACTIGDTTGNQIQIRFAKN